VCERIDQKTKLLPDVEVELATLYERHTTLSGELSSAKLMHESVGGIHAA